MTRLCVCVSGQVRALDEPLTRLARLLQGRDATLVFSLWDRIGRKLDGALNLDQLWRVLDADAEIAIPSSWIGHNAFWEALPELRRRLEALNRSPQPELIRERIAARFPQAIVDIESSDLLDLDFPHPIGEDRHSMRLLYKIWRVNKIKRALERNSGPFDVVIRMRPDLALEQLDLDRVIRDALEGKVVVGYWNNDRAWCSDGFAAGRSKDIDAYSALFARAISEPFAWQHIHIDLADHLLQLGLAAAPYAESETLMDDLRVSATELHGSLVATQDGTAPYSAPHALTLAALAALSKLSAGSADEALAVMLAGAEHATRANDGQFDGFLLVLARVLEAADLPVLAAVAAQRSGAAVTATRFRRGQAAIDALIAGIVASPASWLGLELAWDAAAWAQECERAPAAAALAAGQPPQADAVPTAATLTAPAVLAVLRRLSARGYRELARSLIPRSLAAITLAPARSEATPDVVLELQGLAAEVGAVLPPEQMEALRVVALQHAGDVQALYGLAESLRQVARFDEAAAVQSRAVEMDPHHPGARRQYAEILLALGHHREAREQAEQAASLHDCPEHRVLLAFLAHRAGMPLPPASASDLTHMEPSLRERLRRADGFAAFVAATEQTQTH